MRTCPCGHRPDQHLPEKYRKAFGYAGCVAPACACPMTTEQAQSSLVDTLDVRTGQIEDKAVTETANRIEAGVLMDEIQTETNGSKA